MKKSRLERTFLEELAKLPNISIACERVNLSRQTVYRWMQSDPKFKNSVDIALNFGTESINDLAESKLITNIKNGTQRSIEYWLNNHKKNYFKPRIIIQNKDKMRTLSQEERDELDELLNLK